MSDTRVVPAGSGTLELHQYPGSKVFYLNPACIERFWLADSQDFTQLKLQGEVLPIKVVETPEQIMQLLIAVGGLP